MNNRVFISILVLILLKSYSNAQQWSVVLSPSPSTAGNYLAGAGAVSANDVWAVGARDTMISALQLSRTLTEHWNGADWTQVPSPSPGIQYNLLYAIQGFATNDVYAVGYAAGIPAVPQIIAIHWNGSTWSQMTTPVITGGSEFRCILGFAPNDIYAGGSKDIGAPGPDVGTLVAHWNGSTWDTLTTPNQSNTRSNFITDMKGLSANDIWAVGYSKELAFPFIAMVLHKSGSAWSVQTIPQAGLESFLYSIDIIASNNIWAAGEFNDNGIMKPLFLHYNGSSWSVVTSLAGGYGLVHNSASDIWSTGSGFVHYDGNVWSQVITPIPSGGILRGTARVSSNDIWAAGEYMNGGIRKTLIMHFGSPTGIKAVTGDIPDRYKLSQNYPNPFNPSTNIRFDVPLSSFVSLKVFDITGREVAELVNGNLQAGIYKADWAADGLSSGVYFYTLKAGAFSETKRMMLVK